ncbi:hypothetical protein R3W88_014662 [Solanum pinnatisectum]|uniref:Uncharacterized protein n=1 Tax=Solanum pinnatisectum TaxID=50273 RepID=A0AAV9KSL7_9SOLN|nr:hypothetical protein R3W88_014662 [Solanum pinnatisectum]
MFLQLVNTHIKYLAFDFLTLKPIPNKSIIFSRKAADTSRAAGKPLILLIFMCYIVHHLFYGTGCIPCILWINQETSRHFSCRM